MSDGITSRKADHLRLAIDDDVEVRLRHRASAFDDVRLVHHALPEIDRDAVDPSVMFMGKRLAFPLMVGSMTGGTPEAGAINRRLAEAARACGVGMFLGSQRVMIERPEVTDTFQIRDVAPEIPLVANIGAVQLNLGVTAGAITEMAQAVGADGVVFHLNAAQEAVQPGGDVAFAGLTDALAAAAEAIPLPCGVKEVGNGFSMRSARMLAKLPLAFVESAGRGGTSWTLIEGMRSKGTDAEYHGQLFGDWGIPTVTSLLACVEHAGHPVIASGGLRTGLDGAKAIACGASLCAMALPLLRAAAESTEAAVAEMLRFRDALVTAMFLVGARNIEALQMVTPWLAPGVRPREYEGA